MGDSDVGRVRLEVLDGNMHREERREEKAEADERDREENGQL